MLQRAAQHYILQIHIITNPSYCKENSDKEAPFWIVINVTGSSAVLPQYSHKIWTDFRGAGYFGVHHIDCPSRQYKNSLAHL
jgi:hypothetical protein